MAEDFGLCTEKNITNKNFLLFKCDATFKDEVSNLVIKFLNKLSEKIKIKISLPFNEFLDKNKLNFKFFEIEDKFFEKKIFDFLKQKEFDFEIIQSPMFLCSRDKFNKFAQKKKSQNGKFLSTDAKRLNILISDGKPLGGKWSYDEENRKNS